MAGGKRSRFFGGSIDESQGVEWSRPVPNFWLMSDDERKKKRRLLVFGALGVGIGLGVTLALVRHPLKLANWYARHRLSRAGLRQYFLEGPQGVFSVFKRAEDHPPSEETVVLIHGLGGHAGNWFYTVRALDDYDVAVPDLPGHGDCRLEQLEWTPDELFELFVAEIDAITDDRPLIMVGNSLGGWLSILYALHYPQRVRRLILVNSAGLRFDYPTRLLLPRTRRDARQIIGAVFGDEAPRVPGFMLDALIREANCSPIARALEYSGEPPYVGDRLADIEVPTEIIWGTEDTLIPHSHAYELQKKLRNSRLYLMPGLGHSPQVADARRFNRLLRHILDEPRRLADHPPS